MKFLLKYTTIAIISFSVFSCESDSDPKKTTDLLNLTIDASYLTNTQDNWVIVHDMAGNVLDYQSFETGATLALQTTKSVPDGKISVTFLSHWVISTEERNTIESYTGVATGQSWTLSKKTFPEIDRGTILGTFKVKLSNVQNPNGLNISDKFGYSSGGGWSSGDQIAHFDQMVSDKSTQFLLSIMDGNGVPKYKIFDDVTIDETYELSVADLSAFDKTVQISFPLSQKVQFHVVGFEPGQATYIGGYWVNSDLFGSTSTNLTLGYLNSLENYSTYVYVEYPTHSCEYSKSGDVPGATSLPSTSVFSITDSDVLGFKSSGAALKLRFSEWRAYNHEVVPKINNFWTVVSQDQTQSFKALPAELATLYPSIELDNFDHRGTKFYTLGKSLDQYIGIQFKGDESSEIEESLSVNIK